MSKNERVMKNSETEDMESRTIAPFFAECSVVGKQVKRTRWL